MKKTFSTKLLRWFAKHGRHDLPWQKNPTPYRVWISEIMLQQTQVNTVIPYFKRFMASFPSLKKLALASEDEVLLHWSGLGYYARARNIHKTAKIIHEQYSGQFPKTVEAVSTLPGVGQSTAGAIISFSTQQKAVILDGNVKRVLTRCFGISAPINQSDTLKSVWSLAETLTPAENAHHYNQAIMDLGATLCTRTKPRCTECPFKTTCIAYQNNKATFYPVKTAKKSRPIKNTRMLIILNQLNHVLLVKRPSRGIWGGLWSFPEYDLQADYSVFVHNNILHPLNYIDELETITHHFTHYTLNIFPMILTVSNLKLDINNMVWYKLSALLPGGIPTPIARILQELHE